MSSASIREPASFGKRKEPHTILVIRNGKTRKFTVRPVFFSFAIGTVFMFLFGYFGATAYLIFRDDLIASSYTQQARMQHEYEDRIAALRSKLDRITSRQLLDQQAIENQVRKLLARQERIGGQAGKMKDLLQEARKRGLDATQTAGAVPVPSSNPAKSNASKAIDTITTGSVKPALGDSASLLGYANETGNPETSAFRGTVMSSSFTQDLFGDVASAIGVIDANQRHEVDSLRIAAAKRAVKIENVLESIGVPFKAAEYGDIGGPFVPLDHSVQFETHLQALEKTLDMYDSVSSVAKTVPLGTPVPGAKVSSHYGSRVDPFNGRIAMHSGIDFKAKTGTPVKATGKGVVTKAGRKGGYGKIVEVKHKNGYITRYAHLSRIAVQVGQHVNKGDIVGKVGSTGRSTGPHLHYEVRLNNKARNPSKYIKAGYKIRGLL
ncbi:MAG: M23 family metallopeptidase [Pseudomonadota bacterium]